jgi:hypothetical protein
MHLQYAFQSKTTVWQLGAKKEREAHSPDQKNTRGRTIQQPGNNKRIIASWPRTDLLGSRGAVLDSVLRRGALHERSDRRLHLLRRGLGIRIEVLLGKKDHLTLCEIGYDDCAMETSRKLFGATFFFFFSSPEARPPFDRAPELPRLSNNEI